MRFNVDFPAASNRSTNGYELVSKAKSSAEKHLKSGYNCAQSVVLACSEVLGLEDGTSLVNSCAGLTGGLGYSGCVCGALLGGVMVIGAQSGGNKFGRKNKKALRLTQQLHDKFKERFSTTCCRTLRNGMSYKDKELSDHCMAVTADAAEMVVELLKT